MGGSTISPAGASSSVVSVTAPNSGQVELQVSPRTGGAPQDALFSVTTTSNVPLKNCTVCSSRHSSFCVPLASSFFCFFFVCMLTQSRLSLKVGIGPTEEGGLSTGAKAGIGIGVAVAALGLLGGGGYFVSCANQAVFSEEEDSLLTCVLRTIPRRSSTSMLVVQREESALHLLEMVASRPISLPTEATPQTSLLDSRR